MNKKNSEKSKLVVFDLDGTLIKSPLPEEAKIIWFEKTGNKWPHKGFWSKRESLDMEIFDIPLVKDVHDEYLKINEDSVVVMMTGRITPLSKQVEFILDYHGLTFDEYHYNTGGSTEECKIKTLNELLLKYPNIVDVEQWDDRVSHIPIFQEWGNNLITIGRLKNFKINLVPNGTHK